MPVVGLSNLCEMQTISFLYLAAIREKRLRSGSDPPCTEQPGGLLTMLRFQLSKMSMSSSLFLAMLKSISMWFIFLSPISNCYNPRPYLSSSLSPGWNLCPLFLIMVPSADKTLMLPFLRCFCALDHPMAVALRYRSSLWPSSQRSKGNTSKPLTSWLK